MTNKISAALLSVLVLGIAAGYSFGVLLSASEKTAALIHAEPSVFAPAESSATINLAAVDSNGNGFALPLTVRKSAGNGETLIDINSLVFWFDTQQSIRTAKSVAENITGKNLGRTNLVYFIDSNASVVEGPSAGAALAIATIAALENRTLAPDVMITGTVNSDGTIGEVGGILEKAAAAKQAGARIFLVPKGQGTKTALTPVENCTERDSIAYCTTRYNQTVNDISEQAGMRIREVSSIGEAEKYFFA